MKCILFSVLLLSGCANNRKFLSFCREALPKLDAIVTEQATELEFQQIQLKMCNDLNSALIENKALRSGPTKKAKPRVYKGDGSEESI